MAVTAAIRRPPGIASASHSTLSNMAVSTHKAVATLTILGTTKAIKVAAMAQSSPREPRLSIELPARIPARVARFQPR